MNAFLSNSRRLFAKSTVTNGVKFGLKDIIEISKPIEDAIRNKQPMVALESTVLTHGMPWPINVKTATDLQNIVLNESSIPVTIGVLRNVVKVGFNAEELEELGRSVTLSTKPRKLSRRDLYNVPNIKYGGTTVASTMVIAEKLGIKVFATGGIGGVHRDHVDTADVSADLRELGRTAICVVSSGVKSFLDISKTLEYLETEGVFVCTLGSSEFPGFFLKSSGFQSPNRVDTIEEAANIIHNMEKFDISSGILLAVPIPDGLENDGILIQKALEESLLLTKSLNITGPDITPFVLKKVSELTRGRSLELNVKLIENNALIGGKLALYLNKLKQRVQRVNDQTPENSTFVVIGGSMVDNNLKFKDPSIISGNNIVTEASYHCSSVQTCGGVARNLADVFSQFGERCCFLSAIGGDLFAEFLKRNSPHMDWTKVRRLDDLETASCSVLILSNNEVFLCIGNFEVANQISVDYVAEHLNPIKNKIQLICLDCNVPLSTMEYVVKVAKDNQVAVFVEPTDILLIPKLMSLYSSTKHYTNFIDIVSPNINEFRYLVKLLCDNKSKYNFQINKSKLSEKTNFDFVKNIIQNSNLLNIIPNWIIKLGRDGVVFASKEEFFFLKQSPLLIISNTIVNPSGAGDCLAACSLYLHFKEKMSWKDSIAGGIRMAKESVENKETVPLSLDMSKYSKSSIQSWIKDMSDSKMLFFDE